MRISGICGDCGKYYKGDACPNCRDCKTGKTINIIPDIEPHFNRGLGEYVSSRSEYRAMLKEKGLVEVGNEAKYVSPDYTRNEREKAVNQNIINLRPQAHQMLSQMENSRWN